MIIISYLAVLIRPASVFRSVQCIFIFLIAESKLIQESLLVDLLRELSFLLFPHELLILLLVGLEERLNFPVSVNSFLRFRLVWTEDCIKELVVLASLRR